MTPKAGHTFTAGPVCLLCEGSGVLYAMKSWFPADGYSRHRCAICAGTGRSKYRPTVGYVADMKRNRRAAIAKATAGGAV